MASALDALRNEAKGTGVSVSGYEIAPLTMDMLQFLIDGRKIAFGRELLGSQWSRWRKKNKSKQDMHKFFDDVCIELGFTYKKLMTVLSILSDDETCRAFEADLIEQGVELKDIFTGALSPRRLVLIFDHLPERSKVHLCLGGEYAKWDTKEYMLADLADMMNYQTILIHILAQMQGLSKPIKPPKPVYSRPGEVKKAPKMNSAADLSMLLGAATRR